MGRVVSPLLGSCVLDEQRAAARGDPPPYRLTALVKTDCFSVIHESLQSDHDPKASTLDTRSARGQYIKEDTNTRTRGTHNE